MRMRLTLCLLLVVVAHSGYAADRADRIFVNGKVWTGEDNQPTAEALAVAGDHILAVGTNSQIRALARPDTSVYDLKGRLLAPGFNDAHWHFDPSGNIDLSDITSLPELQKRIAEYARSHADKAWITGVGWGYAIFPNRIPDKKYLDTVLADRPVVVWERDGHMALANSKALAVAGITRETPDPEHGRIEHDPSGEPTGEVKETAVDLVARHIPPPTIEERYQALKRIMELAASYGLTSVQNATAEWSDEDQAAFDRMLSEDAVKLRFYVSLPLSKHPASEELARDKSMRDSLSRSPAQVRRGERILGRDGGREDCGHVRPVCRRRHRDSHVDAGRSGPQRGIVRP